jgi:hypothetical protein
MTTSAPPQRRRGRPRDARSSRAMQSPPHMPRMMSDAVVLLDSCTTARASTDRSRARSHGRRPEACSTSASCSGPTGGPTLRYCPRHRFDLRVPDLSITLSSGISVVVSSPVRTARSQSATKTSLASVSVCHDKGGATKAIDTVS